MKKNFLLEIIDGKPVVTFSEDADALLAKYKASAHSASLFIRPVPSKQKKAGNSEAVAELADEADTDEPKRRGRPPKQ